VYAAQQTKRNVVSVEYKHYYKTATFMKVSCSVKPVPSQNLHGVARAVAGQLQKIPTNRIEISLYQYIVKTVVLPVAYMITHSNHNQYFINQSVKVNGLIILVLS
jgi:hypothetical protein